jgi:exo-beta-1,3-glucanase (GH17 family)
MKKTLQNILFAGSIFLAGNSLEAQTTPLDGGDYSPFRDNQNPEFNIFPTITQIKNDFQYLDLATTRIRTYGCDNILGQIPEIAKENNINIYMGLWLGTDSAANQTNITTAINIANSNNPRLKAVVVGNETLHFGSLTESQQLSYMNDVRSSTTVPIAYADTWDVWLAHPNIAQASDIILVHIYPYWDGIDVNSAAQYTIDKFNLVKNAYPTKTVEIGEMGWPTKGSTVGLAVPSEQNQKTYFDAVTQKAQQNNIRYFWFEAFDEKWKEKYSIAEGGWGLYNSDRTEKLAIQGVIPLPSPVPPVETPKHNGAHKSCSITNQYNSPQPMNWLYIPIAISAAGYVTRRKEQNN